MVEPGQEASRPSTHASAHCKEIHRLKQLLAEKTLEVDFFKGALQKFEARRQRNSGSGEIACTTRTGARWYGHAVRITLTQVRRGPFAHRGVTEGTRRRN